MYYVVKRYFLPVGNDGACIPVWLKSPHWEPVKYKTWQEAADAYIKIRLKNLRAPGVPGYPPEDLDILYEEDS